MLHRVNLEEFTRKKNAGGSNYTKVYSKCILKLKCIAPARQSTICDFYLIFIFLFLNNYFILLVTMFGNENTFQNTPGFLSFQNSQDVSITRGA